MTHDTFALHRGSTPLLVSMPHDGTAIPPDLAARMTPAALRTPDTDWHVSRLYAFARELGASMLVPRHSRYVVDLNRPPDGAALYPGQHETGLCPRVTFSGDPIYLAGEDPGEPEVLARVARYWRPYHDALRTELDRLVGAHGRAVLWEAHTIRGAVPLFFDGALPDLNLGTAAGASCRPALQQRLESVLAAQDAYTHVVNGRFKGGYITRHYADAARGIDAVQLELAQRTYMDEATFAYDAVAAARLEPLLRRLLGAALVP
ncbi:MAG TPA: N-formylglutamate deformylase [Xanthomonadales bacterium]|nr:N-formylglutamate deformylase [Xanthomonadales bacterium]